VPINNKDERQMISRMPSSNLLEMNGNKRFKIKKSWGKMLVLIIEST
jgi:hypothetical protein